MAQLTRSQLTTDITTNIFTNVIRAITGAIAQVRFLNLKDSCVNAIDDANTNGGYMKIDLANGNADVTKIKSTTPGNKFLRDDGSWQPITSASNYGAATGADTYLVNIPGITTYFDGLDLSILIQANNTGTSTINVNTIGVLGFKKFGSVVLEKNDLKAGMVVKGIVVGSDLKIYTVTGNIGEGN